MLVRLLGSVDVVVDDAVREVPGRRARAVLAALALQPGEVVSADHMLDVIWADASATPMSLQSHVSRLRRIVGRHAAIVARSSGYVLEVDGEATDVQAVERLLRQADRCEDPYQRQLLLQDAVALGRGRALAELGELDWFDRHAQRLEQMLLNGRLALVDVRLALGEHLQLLSELSELAGQFPLDEQIHRRLMLALYRAGRQGDALASYQRLRRVLDDELGLEPIPQLRELYTAILRQDPDLSTAAPTVEAPVRPRPVPAQLPLPVRGFCGRVEELDVLDRLVRDGAGSTATTVVVSAISGMAGIGKTALAVHWAHRVADRFPDGQLYVNLRGFDADEAPTDPAAVLRGFLAALGIAAAEIPDDLDARVGLYRSVMAGQRALVVLDNARDAEQVRPLLPAGSGCVALVTSRTRLTPLVAAEGAHPLILDVPSPAEARELVTVRLGTDRVTAEPDAVDEIVDLCGRLPLALVLAAARAATRPRFRLAAVASELRLASAALDALADGDPGTDVRSVFAWSYRALGAAAARLFRLLGLHPGPMIGVLATASLAGVPPAEARTLLDQLARVHLLTEVAPGRYGTHDLLRAYAAELVAAVDSERARRAAVHRLLDYYLRTADAAATMLLPRRIPISLPPSEPGVRLEHLDDYASALSWFEAQHDELIAAVHRAKDGFEGHAWRLAWILRTFLPMRGQTPENVAIQRVGLAAAGRLDDPAAMAHAHLSLTFALSEPDPVEAGAHGRRSLDLFTELGDLRKMAQAHCALISVAADAGRPVDGLPHADRALDLFRRLGDRVWEAFALGGLGWCHMLVGNHQQAVDHCTRALELLQELGDKDGQAGTWESLGSAYRNLADYDRAVTSYRNAIELYTELDHRPWQAYTLSELGDVYHDTDDIGAARDAWQRALHILDGLNDPQQAATATAIRAKLQGGPGRQRRPGPAR